MDIERPEGIAHRFKQHPVSINQHDRMQMIRTTSKSLAELICAVCPSSYERTTALTKLEEAMMWANTCISREGE